MTDTIVETILDSLKEEMEENIRIINGYRTNPNIIYRGSFSPNEVETFPVIGFDVEAEDFQVLYQGEDNVAYIEIMLYGYSYSDGIDRISDIRNLAHDVLNFIHNDWSYTNQTEIINKLDYSGYKTMIFNLPIRVIYDYNNTTIK